MKRLAAAWSRFWFAPIDARALGLMRIALGVILAVNHLSMWPDLDLLLGPDGAVPLSTALGNAYRFRLSIYDLATTSARLHAIHAAGLGVIVALTLGWRTRLMGVLSLLVLVSLFHRDRWMMDGGDRLLRVMALYLCLVPSGLAFSIDALLTTRRLRRQGQSTERSPLAPRLLQRLLPLQLMWMYFHAGWDKLNGEEWINGSALHYTLGDTALQGVLPLTDFLTTTAPGQTLARIGAYATMGWELSFWLLVLWRPTRLLALAIGVFFHLQIAHVMGIGTFSYAALWGYLAFADPSWLGALPARVGVWLERATTPRPGGG